MNRTQELAAEALSLLQECIDRDVFHDAAGWILDHADSGDDYRAISDLEARVRALVGLSNA